MRIFITQALDHPVQAASYIRNIFRQAASYQDVTLNPGQTTSLTRTFTFATEDWASPDNIRLIAWAQRIPPLKEVFQSVEALYPFMADCNGNGVPDDQDILNGTSQDCNLNGVPDECEPGGTSDCNNNGIIDLCDIYNGTSLDCDLNGEPDECQPDCNNNGIADPCDILSGLSEDCDDNNVPDECQPDCNGNGIADPCDLVPIWIPAADEPEDAQVVCQGILYTGTTVGALPGGFSGCGVSNDSPDVWYKFIPANSGLLTISTCGSQPFDTVLSLYRADMTEYLCNNNYVACQPASQLGASVTTGNTYYIRIAGNNNTTGEFQFRILSGPNCLWDVECNDNGIPDECEPDCNANDIPDDCDIASGFSQDLDGNGIPDECEGVDHRGDLNCDGAINALDINPFVLAMTNVATYYQFYPTCDHTYADIDCNDAVNALDINPFVQCITGGNCPACP